MASNVRRPKTSIERDLEQACSDLLSYDNWRPLKTDPQSERGFVKRVMSRLERHPNFYRSFDEIRAVLASCTRDSGFGELGMADRQYIRYTWGALADHGLRFDRSASVNECRAIAQVLWIEWKRPGAKLAPHQETWHLEERLRGALTVKAGVDFPATVDGFLTWYRSSGLMRRPL